MTIHIRRGWFKLRKPWSMLSNLNPTDIFELDVTHGTLPAVREAVDQGFIIPLDEPPTAEEQQRAAVRLVRGY